MTTVDRLPYYELDFAIDGSLNGATGGGGGLAAAVASGDVTELFIFSHGWNNGVNSARDLYQSMFGLLATQLGSRVAGCAAVGVIWPSLLFPDDDPSTAPPVPSTGADLTAALTPAFPDHAESLTTIGGLLDDRPQQPDALERFHALASGLVTTPSNADEDNGEASFKLRRNPRDGSTDTMAVLGQAAMMSAAPGGNAEGLGNPFAPLWSGAREVLRTLSYYEMKNRAGVVGQTGLGPLLATLQCPHGAPRIHLMGHSFGARLVAYALAGLPSSALGSASPVKSLTLIQGAFSHYAFTAQLPLNQGRSGSLAAVADRVDGPLLATFSNADRAVGWWYPMASMLAGQDAQSAVDLTAQWGAMGHDGYQVRPAATTVAVHAPGEPYLFAPGSYYSLDCNAVISTDQSAFSGAHSDIRHPEVLWAVAAASGRSSASG